MITISKPKIEDAEAIHNVMKKSWYATYINNKIGITKEDIDTMYANEPESQIEAIRKRARVPTDNDVSLIGKDGENVVGFIRLKKNTDPVELVSMYVDPSYFNQGIGTKLWLEAIQKLPKGKEVVVEVATYTKAIDFYKKIGFSETGEKSTTEKMLRSGNRIPLTKMRYPNN